MTTTPPRPRLNKTEIARDYHRRFPNLGSLTLAKLMCREHPELFHSVERARTSVRAARGNIGTRCRKRHKGDCFRPNGANLPQLPEPIFELENWGKVEVCPGPARALILSDIHLPFHDKTAVETAVAAAKDFRADHILINGDLVDDYTLSDFTHVPRALEDFQEELVKTRAFLAWLRSRFPQAKIVWKEGNHEERYKVYVSKHAPMLYNLEGIQPPETYKLADLDISYIDHKRPAMLGKLLALHGHEYRTGRVCPVSPARTMLLKAKCHCIIGHFHQASQQQGTTADGNVITTFSTGCLCHLHPQYAPFNEWCHGFALVEIDKHGAFHVENKRIVHGQAY